MAIKILFILRKPPYSGAYAQESLDVAMTLAAFDQDVALLLLDDAVFQVKSGQQLLAATFKNLAAIYQALPIYDINDLYVETESLNERGLTLANLCIPVVQVSRTNVGEFCKQFDVIYSG